MKTVTVFVLAVYFGVVSGVQGAGRVNCDVTVIGQGNPAIDVPAVLAAVNGPSSSGKMTVCLKGAFDFGTGGGPDTFVDINPPNATTELNITGLDDKAGNKATIRNGFQPLAFDPASTLLSLSIRNLSFEQPLMTAISIFRGNGLVEILDNEIHGVVTAAAVIGQPMTFREGIAITSAFSDIAGKVVIKNNKVDGGVYGPGDASITVNAGICVTGKLSGVNQYDITGEVLVEDNLVKNWSGNSIYSLGLADVIVRNNRVEPGPIANGSGSCVANGIVIIANDCALVEKNTINKAPALKLDGNSPACTFGIGLSFANNNVFRANKVTGTGLYAIGLLGTSQNNLFVGNNLAGFSFYSTGATVGLSNGATNNTFVGNSGTVMGNTSANTITGLAPVPGGVGEAVSDGLSH